MKKSAFLFLLLLLAAGCHLLPKRVELFQKKVKALPAKTEKTLETERQAAAYILKKTEEAHDAAIAEDSSESVVSPIADAETASGALSLSLGPPESPWKHESERLAGELATAKARYSRAIEKFRDRNEELEGKKVEGTGLVRVGYFTYIAVIGGCIMVVFLVVKTGLSIYGGFNPLVGAGLRVSSAVASRAVNELAKGGKKFIGYVDSLDLDDKAKAIVKDTFFRAHKEAQSGDVQDLVQQLPHNVPSK